MPFLVERISCRSLDFRNQRRAYLLRKDQKLSWVQIAKRVVDVGGKHPSWPTVRCMVKDFNSHRGCRAYHHNRRGRKKWEMIPEVRKFITRRLLVQRMTRVVTAASLAEDVAKEEGVCIEAEAVRKLLRLTLVRRLKDCGTRYAT